MSGAVRTVAAGAAALPSRAARLSLYRSLLHTASQFRDYNFRLYAQRKVKEKFRAHQHESDPTKLSSLFDRAHKDLKMLQRQTLINQLYSAGDSVIEQSTAQHTPFHSAFQIRSAPAPQQAFQQWLKEAAVASDSAGANPADVALPAPVAAKMEPGQATRLQADNKGQHTTPAKLEGYSS